MYHSRRLAHDLNFGRGVIPFFLDIPQQSSILVINPVSWECPLILARNARSIVITHPSGRQLALLAQMHQKYKDFEYLNSCSIQFVQCAMDDSLPFRDNSFDLILCNVDIGFLDCIPRRWKLNGLHQTVDEIHRVMDVAGQLFLVVSNKWIPYSLIDYQYNLMDHRYKKIFARWGLKVIQMFLHIVSHRNTANWMMRPEGWHQILHDSGFHYLETYGLIPEYTRVFEVFRWSDSRSVKQRDDSLIKDTFTRDFGIAAFKTIQRQSLWEQLYCHIVQQLDGIESSIRSDLKIFVRRAGKMNFTLTNTQEDIQVMVKVPWTKKSQRQEAKNFDALISIQTNQALSPQLRGKIPTSIISGVYQGQPYFVEEFIDGIPLSKSYQKLSIPPNILAEALRFATALYENTVVLTKIDSDWLDQTLDEFINVALNASHRQDIKEVLVKLVEYLRCHLVDRDIWTGWSHGDFSIGNCLSVDREGLSGVIDWESFTPNGFPFADAIHFINTMRNRSGLPTWQMLQYLADSSPQSALDMMQSYVRHYNIPREIIPSVILMVWVDYVRLRLDVGQFKTKWMQEHFYIPMRLITKFLSRD